MKSPGWNGSSPYASASSFEVPASKNLLPQYFAKEFEVFPLMMGDVMWAAGTLPYGQDHSGKYTSYVLSALTATINAP